MSHNAFCSTRPSVQPVARPNLHPRVRRSIAKGLAKLGLTVLDGPDAKVTRVTRDAVTLRDGHSLPSMVTIWTAGFGVPDLATDTVLSRIAEEQPRPINVGFFCQCISLGHRAAVVQLASKDDTAHRFYIGGRLAAKIKKLSYKGLVKDLTDEARKPGSYHWSFKDDKRQQRLQAIARPAA